MMAAKSLADQAYDAIEQLITSDQLTPATLVSEASLMDATGLGRTPVREALQRLARDRMVRIHPSRGVLVSEITVESQLRLLEIRRSLEVLAIELACDRVTGAECAAMAQLRDSLASSDFSLSSYAETIKETHQLITKAAHNEFLSDAISPLQVLSRRFWLLNLRDEQAEIAKASGLHREILTAIIDGDTQLGVHTSITLNDYLVEHAHRTVGLTVKGAASRDSHLERPSRGSKASGL